MFTGLVQTTGSLRHLNPTQVEITPDVPLADVTLGDSIAVDGVCLTVAALTTQGFWADVSPETLRRSTLGSRTPGQRVNLEPSLRVGDKLGGHFVTGHIDGVGELAQIQATATAWELDFCVPDVIFRYVVEKGSIAINGISLTVAALTSDTATFRVAVIPHTYAHTNLRDLHLGDPVNVEGDILGKYVERLMLVPAARISPLYPPVQSPVSLDFLQEHGYL
ncbi:MAG: riboflavin synthase [Synechococcales cyanobacterium]